MVQKKFHYHQLMERNQGPRSPLTYQQKACAKYESQKLQTYQISRLVIHETRKEPKKVRKKSGRSQEKPQRSGRNKGKKRNRINNLRLKVLYLCSTASSIVATRTLGIPGGFPIILNSILLTFLNFSSDALEATE
jgi:hypothetical protein